MVAFSQQQLEGQSTIALDPLRGRLDVETLLGAGHAGGGRPSAARYLDQAQSTAAMRRQSLESAQRWHMAPLLADNRQKRLTLPRTDQLAVDGHGDGRRRAHARFSTTASGVRSLRS